jgi:hypothetical protein
MLMTINQFIFSNSVASRYQRHIVFWLFWYSLNVFVWPYQNFTYQVFDVLGDVVFSYTSVYLLIPTFFQKRKYILFAVGISLLTLTTYYYYLLLHFALGKGWGTSAAAFWNTLLDLITNTFVVCIFLYTMKVLRDWLVKDIEHASLTRENANAELELLKARVHPHFLFNTLNNIYSLTLNKSLEAAEIVTKLSDLLKYMITECDQPLVPLEKELKMINDYFSLEQIRYGERLDLQIEIRGDSQNKLIAPLLLIPFVENSFKHGASKMLTLPWITLSIDINDHTIDFSLINSKPPHAMSDNGKNGVGLANVRKRLKILYPEKHHVLQHKAKNSFSVYVQVPLQTNTDSNSSLKTSPYLSTPTIDYA